MNFASVTSLGIDNNGLVKSPGMYYVGGQT